MKFLESVFSIIDTIPDISQLPVCPRLFSDDTEKHDCDDCEGNFDCKSCWKEAIIKADGHERIERLREEQDNYVVNAYHWAHRKTFVDNVCEFVYYVEVEELGVRPNLFIETWSCGSCHNRWIRDESHDSDLCLECWRKVIREAYDKELKGAWLK
ncbi:MAG: hypothetical protein ABFD07_18510 [Methanobacterium sp.]